MRYRPVLVGLLAISSFAFSAPAACLADTFRWIAGTEAGILDEVSYTSETQFQVHASLIPDQQPAWVFSSEPLHECYGAQIQDAQVLQSIAAAVFPGLATKPDWIILLVEGEQVHVELDPVTPWASLFALYRDENHPPQEVSFSYIKSLY